MRKLSREYGYSALGVYIALTALDLPFCYLAVSYLGSERIARWEHAVLSYIKSVAKWPMGKEGEKIVDEGADHVQRKVPLEEVQGREDGAKRVLAEDQTYMLEDHGYMEAEKANQGDNASKISPVHVTSALFFPPSLVTPLDHLRTPPPKKGLSR